METRVNRDVRPELPEEPLEVMMEVDVPTNGDAILVTEEIR